MRLIDAYKVRCDRDDYDTYADYIKAFDAINEAPTVDAVPVTHCKDCNLCRKTHFDQYCEVSNQRCDDDDYCSWAERKDNGNR